VEIVWTPCRGGRPRVGLAA